MNILVSVCLTVTLAADGTENSAKWPQFRGPGGLSVGADGQSYPAQLGPNRNVEWKTALPPGNSSPCIWGSRIFLTGFDKQKMQVETLCLNRTDGHILWRNSVPVMKLESSLHPSNGPATPTPVTDGERVYVYFGSFGLIAYNFDGKEAWRQTLPTPQMTFATGSSPVIVGDLLVLAYPGRQAALYGIDRRTGTTVWKKEKPKYRIGYATPMVRSVPGGAEIVLAQQNGVVAYDPKDGAERWWVGGLAGGGIPSPAAGDGLIFVNAHFPGGDPDERMKLPDFDELLKKYDKNKDGKLSDTELPKDLVIFNRGSENPDDNITVEDIFPMADKNRDKEIERTEWEQLAKDLLKSESALVAIRPQGNGDLTKDQVVWREKRSLPEVPSPVCYQGRLYLVKDGGIVSCLDAQNGKLVYRKRLGGGGIYYASPVAAGNQIYFSSRDGVVVVVAAGDQGEILAKNNLHEQILATPALVDGRLYVRAEGNLYAFRSAK